MSILYSMAGGTAMCGLGVWTYIRNRWCFLPVYYLLWLLLLVGIGFDIIGTMKSEIHFIEVQWYELNL